MISTRLPAIRSLTVGSQCPASCPAANRGKFLMLAMITPAVHSAVAGVCAPLALQSVMPAGM